MVNASGTHGISEDAWQKLRDGFGANPPKFKGDGEAVKLCDRIWFEAMIGTAVFVNVVVMALEIELADDRVSASERFFPWIMFDVLFCTFFVVEIGLRLHCYGTAEFIRKPLHIFDIVLVSMSIFDVIVQYALDTTSGLQMFMLLRILRLSKFGKIIKVVEQCKELHLILSGFFSSVRTLFWVVVMMVIVIFMAAIVFRIVVGAECDTQDFRESYFYHFGSGTDPGAKCKEYWGSLLRSMYTLWQVTTLESWSQVIARPVLDVRPYLFGLFVSYQLFTTFGLLTIVVAVIVEGTIRAAQNDEVSVARQAAQESSAHLNVLRSIFLRANQGGDDTVSVDELCRVLMDDDFRRQLLVMNIIYDDPQEVFQIIDSDGTGQLDFPEFVKGFMRMRGMASAKEVLKTQSDIEKLHREIYCGRGAASANTRASLTSTSKTGLLHEIEAMMHQHMDRIHTEVQKLTLRVETVVRSSEDLALEEHKAKAGDVANISTGVVRIPLAPLQVEHACAKINTSMVKLVSSSYKGGAHAELARQRLSALAALAEHSNRLILMNASRQNSQTRTAEQDSPWMPGGCGVNFSGRALSEPDMQFDHHDDSHAQMETLARCCKQLHDTAAALREEHRELKRYLAHPAGPRDHNPDGRGLHARGDQGHGQHPRDPPGNSVNSRSHYPNDMLGSNARQPPNDGHGGAFHGHGQYIGDGHSHGFFSHGPHPNDEHRQGIAGQVREWLSQGVHALGHQHPHDGRGGGPPHPPATPPARELHGHGGGVFAQHPRDVHAPGHHGLGQHPGDRNGYGRDGPGQFLSEASGRGQHRSDGYGYGVDGPGQHPRDAHGRGQLLADGHGHSAHGHNQHPRDAPLLGQHHSSDGPGYGGPGPGSHLRDAHGRGPQPGDGWGSEAHGAGYHPRDTHGHGQRPNGGDDHGFHSHGHRTHDALDNGARGHAAHGPGVQARDAHAQGSQGYGHQFQDGLGQGPYDRGQHPTDVRGRAAPDYGRHAHDGPRHGSPSPSMYDRNVHGQGTPGHAHQHHDELGLGYRRDHSRDVPRRDDYGQEAYGHGQRPRDAPGHGQPGQDAYGQGQHARAPPRHDLHGREGYNHGPHPRDEPRHDGYGHKTYSFSEHPRDVPGYGPQGRGPNYSDGYGYAAPGQGPHPRDVHGHARFGDLGAPRRPHGDVPVELQALDGAAPHRPPPADYPRPTPGGAIIAYPQGMGNQTSLGAAAQKRRSLTKVVHEGSDQDFPLHEEFLYESSDLSQIGEDNLTDEREWAHNFDHGQVTPHWWIWSPNSSTRVTYDMVGSCVLLYDLVMIPVNLGFGQSDKLFFMLMHFIVLGYWTLDILSSFITGFVDHDGALQMGQMRIIKHYLRHWFCLDLGIILVDWMELAVWEGSDFAESAGMLRVGKLFRVLRVLRMFRLLRLAKLRKTVNTFYDYIDSEYLTICLGIVKTLLFILAMNHFIACCWFKIGSTRGGWVAQHHLDKGGFWLQYGTALHWSLSQFTPAGININPYTDVERFFAVTIVLFALVVFSSFISSVTSSMTNLRNLTAIRDHQCWLLRKYLRQNKISPELSIRTSRYVTHSLEKQQKVVQQKDVHLLTILSAPLRMELMTELYEPLIICHPLFSTLSLESPAAVRKICATSITDEDLGRGDILFSLGEEAHVLYVLRHGCLMYGSSGGGSAGCTERLFQAGDWCCEPTLWTTWLHRGTAQMGTESTMIKVNAKRFREEVTKYPVALRISRRRGVCFLRRLRAMPATNDLVKIDCTFDYE